MKPFEILLSNSLIDEHFLNDLFFPYKDVIENEILLNNN